MPWVAKRLWLTKDEATARFGKAKAEKLTYATRESSGRAQDNPSETAEAWEIWDKRTRTVYWYGEGCTQLLDEKKDPLKLKNFFPCPRPLRAIHNTRTFVPRALYSQYKSQAETLNTMTKRIRLLSEALRVVGLYDGSQKSLADALNPAAGNRMIAVDSWAMFAQAGGINGSVVWLPLDAVVKALTELLKAREVAKQEIYEITGFSDIVRGMSKASETLGAQELKANWAGARVRKMQAEVQRFVKDMLALAGEVIAEHCSPGTIALFSGIQFPSQEEMAANPDAQAKMKLFMDACKLLQSELLRVSSIDIETDSTLLADTAAEREDRAKFLAAAGAFLQQAVPAMEATPELGPLLGAMLMFTVRSFPSARVIEDEFEKVQKSMAGRQPNADPNGTQAKANAEAQKLQQEGQLKSQELQQKAESEAAKLALETQKEQNRAAEKQAELELKAQELELKRMELELKKQELEQRQRTEQFKVLHDAGMREEERNDTRADKANERVDAAVDAERSEAREDFNAEREDARVEADREQEYDRMDRDEAGRDAAKAAAKAKEGARKPGKGKDA